MLKPSLIPARLVSGRASVRGAPGIAIEGGMRIETVPQSARVSPLAGWGRYPRIASEILSVHAPDEAAAGIAGREGVIARGLGRAYGDAAIGACGTLIMTGLDRVRSFDPATGRIEVEAGVSLDRILQDFVPRGFFPPVVPGTRFVTVGGMIASDVHGKNHHCDGGFGAHVETLTLMLPDGSHRTCSRERDAALFFATIGGMGLTGPILGAAFHLRPIETGWITRRTRVATDLAAVLAGLDATADSTYSVAWIDCLALGKDLGRGLIFRGEHASRTELTRSDRHRDPFPEARTGRLGIPFDCAAPTLNRMTVKAFNALYYRRGAKNADGPALVPWHNYFFPLDGLSNWNRLYGARGFLQHQCVVPPANASSVLAEILGRVARLGSASPLAVLKQLGPSEGMMSFPVPGYTLALDLPATPSAFTLLDEIDRVVVATGGRLYLAKDARQSRTTFEAGYPNLAAFQALRRDLGAEQSSASHLSTRLGL